MSDKMREAFEHDQMAALEEILYNEETDRYEANDESDGYALDYAVAMNNEWLVHKRAWQAAQSVAVEGEPVAWVRKDKLQHVNTFGPALCHVYATEQPGTVALIEKPTNSIPAAELASLREKAARIEQVEKERDEANARLHDVSVACATAEQERDELQKRAERMQKALSDIAEWTDRYTTPGHPVSTIASAAIAQGKGSNDLPATCRNRLMAEGKPYPRSGCAHCKTGGITGCQFDKQAQGKGEG